MDDLLPRVLRVKPAAAAIQNLNDDYAIDLAIQCGRKWDSGCRILLEAYPPAILVHQARDAVAVKTIIYQLSQMSHYTAIFEIIRAKPESLF